MVKIFLSLLVLVSFSFGQQKVSAVPFIAGNDTIKNINAKDTLDYAITYSGLNWSAWMPVTKCVQDSVLILVTDKTGEVTKVYNIADEPNWTWAQIMRLRIRSSTGNIVSNSIYIGDSEGAITVFVQPDTVGTNTIYKVRVGGR